MEKELLQKLVEESKTIKEILEKLDLKITKDNYKKLYKKLDEYSIDYSEILNNPSGCIIRYKIEDILVENSSYTANSRLKNRLIKEGFKQNICEICGQKPFHNGKELTLQLHHINGNHQDNRLENLQILCPNCHSKTHNFRNKNGKNTTEARRLEVKKNHLTTCEYCGKEFYTPRLDKVQRFCCREHYETYMKEHNEKVSITKEKLVELCNKCNNITQIAEELNVTRPTARKYLIEYDLYDDFKMKYDFHSKIVLQYDINLNLIKEWPSIKDIEDTLHIYHVSDCASGKRRSAGGFIWRYKE